VPRCYLVELAERVIDADRCFAADTRTHVSQDEAREERMRYHAVQHAKAAGNVGIATRPAPGRGHVPSRFVLRRRHPRLTSCRLQDPLAAPGRQPELE
jgi:hypothetical protein